MWSGIRIQISGLIKVSVHCISTRMRLIHSNPLSASTLLPSFMKSSWWLYQKSLTARFCNGERTGGSDPETVSIKIAAYFGFQEGGGEGCRRRGGKVWLMGLGPSSEKNLFLFTKWQIRLHFDRQKTRTVTRSLGIWILRFNCETKLIKTVQKNPKKITNRRKGVAPPPKKYAAALKADRFFPFVGCTITPSFDEISGLLSQKSCWQIDTWTST